MAVDVTLRNFHTDETDSESVNAGEHFSVDDAGNLIIYNNSEETVAIYKVGYWISAVKHDEDDE